MNGGCAQFDITVHAKKKKKMRFCEKKTKKLIK